MSIKNQYRLLGSFIIILGVAYLIVFVTYDKLRAPCELIYKIAVTVLFLNAFVGLTLFGFLTFIGKIKIKTDERFCENDKILNNFLIVILSSPTWLTFTYVLYAISENIPWKITWSLLLSYPIYILYKGFAVLFKKS